MNRTRLWHFDISHYNEKVRWALDRKRWPHERHALVPGFHIPRARWVSGQHQLPVLEVDGRVLIGSAIILAELERMQPDPPLFPAEPAERERALAIQAHFDTVVAPDVRRLFWSTYLPDAAACARMATARSGPLPRVAFRLLFPLMRPLFRRNMGVGRDEVEQALERLGSHFDRLEAEIGPRGFLVGERFGVADLTAAAVMTAIIRPPQFPYPLPEPWPAALVSLRRSVAQRTGCEWVLEMYARHRDPSAATVDRSQ